MPRPRLPLTATLVAVASACSARADPGDWPLPGADLQGTRYSPLAQVDRANVGTLASAWQYDFGETGAAFRSESSPRYAATPIAVFGRIYVSSPLGKVIALDPDTGAVIWLFDPRIDQSLDYGDFTNRGATAWTDASGTRGPCARRIFIASIDARLHALDADTGAPCTAFGDSGSIDLRKGLRIAPFEPPAYEQTSPPLVFGDLVITGAGIADNSRTAPASGEVRAFDVRTGALRWSWDPIPQSPRDPVAGSWNEGSATRSGAANVWSLMSADASRGLVFAPTSSAAPDYYGVLRPGENRYANSIVALDAASGTVRWHFQTVHHDLWDYDNASPPVLIDLQRNGTAVPALLQATKSGQLFVLDRTDGTPLFPVKERTVPASDIPGEHASATQPFNTVIAPLSPQGLAADEVWGQTEADRAACAKMIEGLRNEGPFTPPSTRGTLVRPSNIGGAHWGGLAVDPQRRLAVVPVNRHAAMVQLIPREAVDFDQLESESDRLGQGWEYNEMSGTPYLMRRRPLLSPSGLPCTAPPFGALVAIDLATGQRAWEVPLGSFGPLGEGRMPPENSGSPNLGGPIVTAGGLVFIGATRDERFRAYDIETGRELWQAALPGRGRATPMSFRSRRSGRQFVAIVADGGPGRGGHLVAFALPPR